MLDAGECEPGCIVDVCYCEAMDGMTQSTLRAFSAQKKIPDVHHSKDFHYNISFKDTNLCTSMSKDALVDLLVALRGYVLDCLLVGFY